MPLVGASAALTPALSQREREQVRSGGMTGPFRVGVDIGGTFTDLLAMDERSGRTFVLKQPSTASPVEAVVDGIRELNVRHGIDGLHIGYFAHGTTIGVNTLLQRSGARVGVLTTRGFRDVLEPDGLFHKIVVGEPP